MPGTAAAANEQAGQAQPAAAMSVSNAVPVDDAYRSVSTFAESIATFFRKRAELEAAHLVDLEKLLYKHEEADRRILDVAFKQSSVHHAWTQIKGILHAELTERRNAVYKLQHSVVEPLVAFKDQKERQRKRIKEETARTATEHADYKAHTLRLKRMYQRKSEEVRSLIQISESSTSGYSPAGSNSGGSNAASGYVSPTQPGPSSLGLEASRSRSGSRPTSRSGIDLAAETGPSSARNAGKADVLISGATSTSLKDAHSPPQKDSAALFAIKNSRSQINSLIQKLSSTSTRLSNEGNLKPSSHHIQSRLSKAKREAEECDAQYRAALHHLETLRLQRERVHKASLGSLSEYTYEFSDICKSVFVQYCDTWATKALRTGKTCETAKTATHAISPVDDVASFSQAINLDVFMEEPLPYENYHVGVSYSLIFGVSLSEYSASNDGVLIPLTVQRAILEIESRGIETEGIYRVPGKLGLIQQVVQQIEQDEITFEFDPDKHDVHTVAGVLKLYLRQLPDPLLPISASEREQISLASPSPDDLEDPIRSDAFRLLERKVRKMPPAHQATAKMLVAHFERVLSKQEKNKMSIQALTLCLNPVVFPEEANLAAYISGPKHDRCLEYLITYRQELFAGLPAAVRQGRASGSHSEHTASRLGDDDEDPPYRRSSNDFVRSRGVTPRSSNQSLSATSNSEALHTPIAAMGNPTSPTSLHTADRDGPVMLSPPLSLVGDSEAAVAPKRQFSFSKRARSGSQSLANAMKSLSRNRSTSSNQSSHMSPPHPLPAAATGQTMPLSPILLPPLGPGSPLKEATNFDFRSSPPEDYSAEPTPTQAKPPPLPARRLSDTLTTPRSPPAAPFEQSVPAGYSLPLPAGAAPLLTRPPSFSDSNTGSSAPSTPGLSTAPSIPPAKTSQTTPLDALQTSIDPDEIYEDYHRSHPSQA